MRSSVDLPQPDGPRRAQNWPSSTVRSSCLIASTVPYRFFTPRSSTSLIGLIPHCDHSLGRYYDIAALARQPSGIQTSILPGSRLFQR